VDNLAKRREALPHLAGIYFVTPTEQSARLILEDWKARKRAPLRLFFFFFFLFSSFFSSSGPYTSAPSPAPASCSTSPLPGTCVWHCQEPHLNGGPFGSWRAARCSPLRQPCPSSASIPPQAVQGSLDHGRLARAVSADLATCLAVRVPECDNHPVQSGDACGLRAVCQAHQLSRPPQHTGRKDAGGAWRRRCARRTAARTSSSRRRCRRWCWRPSARARCSSARCGA